MPFLDVSPNHKAEVDEIDHVYFCLLTSWWMDHGYVTGRIGRRVIKMHKLVAQRMGLKGKIDHKDRDTLNNKRGNIRKATGSQNSANSKIYKNNMLGVKGVRAFGSRYQARIRINQTLVHLGSFDTVVEAAKAYNAAAVEAFGEFASLNEIQ